MAQKTKEQKEYDKNCNKLWVCIIVFLIGFIFVGMSVAFSITGFYYDGTMICIGAGVVIYMSLRLMRVYGELTENCPYTKTKKQNFAKDIVSALRKKNEKK